MTLLAPGMTFSEWLLLSLTACVGCLESFHVRCASGCGRLVCLGLLSDHQRLREARRPQFCFVCIDSAKAAA